MGPLYERHCLHHRHRHTPHLTPPLCWVLAKYFISCKEREEHVPVGSGAGRDKTHLSRVFALLADAGLARWLELARTCKLWSTKRRATSCLLLSMIICMFELLHATASYGI